MQKEEQIRKEGEKDDENLTVLLLQKSSQSSESLKPTRKPTEWIRDNTVSEVLAFHALHDWVR